MDTVPVVQCVESTESCAFGDLDQPSESWRRSSNVSLNNVDGNSISIVSAKR